MVDEGPIKHDRRWPVTALAEITSKIGSGATPVGGAEAYLPTRTRFALVRSQNVFDHHFDHAGLAFITDEQADGLRGVLLQPDDILLNITGDGVTFGRACIVPKDVLPACVNQHVSIIRVDPRRADAGFVLAFLTHQGVKSYIESFNAGGSRRAITKGHIESFRLPLPPLPEQHAIAHVLRTLDDKIEVNRQMNATLDAMARALFRSWFMDFDPTRAKLDGCSPSGLDPGTAALFPAAFQDSPIGPLPKGWQPGKIGDIAVNPRRGIQAEKIALNTPYIALEHMPRRCITLDEWEASDDVESGKLIFKKGEILFGKLRPYFHKVGVAPLDGVCSTDILVLAPQSPAWFGFLLGHASSDEVVQFADLASTGTKMPRTNWNDISSFKIAIPPEPIAAAFNRRVQPLVETITANIHQSRTLAALRDVLLPKLLEGELNASLIRGIAS